MISQSFPYKSPYENSKRSIQQQMAVIAQKRAMLERQKVSCPPERRSLLERQEAQLYQQERNLQIRLSSVERMESQWMVSKQKADEARFRQQQTRIREQIRPERTQPQATQWERRAIDEKTRQTKDDANQFYHKAA